jgi:hypothetical protein
MTMNKSYYYFDEFVGYFTTISVLELPCQLLYWVAVKLEHAMSFGLKQIRFTHIIRNILLLVLVIKYY